MSEPQYGSIEHLIVLAIQGERLTETFYRRLALKFSAYPEIAGFWSAYAAEEDGHARWLEGLRLRAGAGRLREPADADVLQQATRALNTSVDFLVSGIRTLQDAYDLANELEHNETNAVFEFLINHFTEDPQTLAFLRAQLNDHVGRLSITFPAQYGTGTLRRGIMAGEG